MVYTLYNFRSDLYHLCISDMYVNMNGPEFHPKRKKLKGYQKVRK